MLSLVLCVALSQVSVQLPGRKEQKPVVKQESAQKWVERRTYLSENLYQITDQLKTRGGFKDAKVESISFAVNNPNEKQDACVVVWTVGGKNRFSMVFLYKEGDWTSFPDVFEGTGT